MTPAPLTERQIDLLDAAAAFVGLARDQLAMDRRSTFRADCYLDAIARARSVGAFDPDPGRAPDVFCGLDEMSDDMWTDHIGRGGRT